MARRRTVLLCLVAAVAGGAIWATARVRTAARSLLESEDRLHAWILTTDVLAEFISRDGRWPGSWDELKTVPPRESARFTWPGSAAELAGMVEINFEAGLPPLDPAPAYTEYVRPRGPLSAGSYLDFQWTHVLAAVREARAASDKALTPLPAR